MSIPRTLIVAGIAGSVGSLATLFAQQGRLSLVPGGMSYADLAATLLAAVGVIVAIFGGILAIAALWGFQQMKQEAVRAASDAALTEVREQIANGGIRLYILDEVQRRIKDEFDSSAMDDRINARVDRVALGNPEDRLLDEDEDGDDT